MARDPATDLTPLQARFCEEYIVDLNGLAAYRRASPNCKSDAGAGVEAHKCLNMPKVQKRIAELQAKRAKRTEITADRVLKELAAVGFSSLDNYVIDDQGNATTTPAAPADAMRAVASIRKKTRILGKGQTEHDTEIKLWDKVNALDKMARHLGMYGSDSLQLSGKEGGKPIEVKADVTSRIDQLAAAFLGVAHRAGESGTPGDDIREPLDT